MSCTVTRGSIISGVQEDVKNRLLGSSVFIEQDELFIPKEGVENYQSVVNEINIHFGEEIVMPMNDPEPKFAIVEPSDKLIHQYFETADDEELNDLRRKTKTPQFRQWFGNWETVKDAVDLAPEIQGTARESFIANPQQALFEIATQVNQNDGSPENSTGAISEIYPQRIIDIAKKLFPTAKAGDVFTPIIGSLDQNGLPAITDGMYTNAKGEQKSTLNRGSFISNDNSISIDPQYPRWDKVDYSFRVDILDGTRKVGEVNVENDGEYLNVFMSQAASLGTSNVGSNAYMKLADKARSMGLMLRSDRISDRMSEAAKRLWNRFVEAGQAEIINDRYVFTGEGTAVGDNIYMSAVAGDTLTEDQDRMFKKLQKNGVISTEVNMVDGRVYYKVPGNSSEKVERLKQIIKNQGLDFIHLTETIDATLIQLGKGENETLNETIAEEEDSSVSSKAGQVTKRRVLQFLNNIGFTNIQEVSQLVYKGEPIPGIAYTDLMNGIMQIVKGTEDYNLPEEAMHILVKLIQNSRPELYAAMRKEVVNYKLYSTVLRDPAYTNNKLYQNEDGTLNIEKIREEAVAKLLAEYLINQLEGTNESAAKLETAYSFWKSIIQWIREVFGQYTNPFKSALEAIDNNDLTFGTFVDVSSDDIFLSAKSLDKIDEENQFNKDIYERIKNRPTEQSITKVVNDEENAYYINGVKMDPGHRVSDIADRYLKKLFGNRNFDESLREFYDQSRQDGTYIHEIAEEVINSYIDPETGLMRRNPAPITFPIQGNPLQGKMIRDLQNYLKKMMASYPEGTRFITEQVVYDPNTAYNVNGKELKGRIGTIDFAAIKPDGTVDIIDWKSMLLEDLEGAKDYKREAIFSQLNEYKRILKDEYGIEKFGKIRAIPIKKHYKTDKATKVRTLQSIEIGNIDPAKIGNTERYLRPIITPEESTGSETRDEMIQTLQALYQRYIDKGYFKDARNILNDIQDAIYQMRVSNSVENLANYFTDLYSKFTELTNQKEALLKSNNKDDIKEALALIKFYEDIIKNVVEPSFYLQEDTSIEKDSRSKVYANANKLNFFVKKFSGMRDELLNTQAEKDNIFGLLVPEKVVNLARRYFRSMGSQDIASVRYMYELVKKAYNKIDISTDEELKRLKGLKTRFDDWRKANNKTDREGIELLVDINKGKIHSKIDSEFYIARQAALDSKNKETIKKFIEDNYNTAEYVKWYTDELAAFKQRLKETTYDVDKTKDATIKRRKISEFETNFNIYTHPITAFGRHNSKVWSKNLKEEKWLSKEYQELQKPGNEALLDMYNFMVEKNKQLADTGAIEDWKAYTFLPNMRRGLGDVLDIDDTSALEKIRDVAIRAYTDWRKSISIDDYEMNYQGARDPFSGEKLNKRFVPFVQNMEASEKSYDIFTVYGLMTKEIYKEQYLQENDEILRGLLELEKNKETLLQNKFGTIAEDANGKPITSKEKGGNAKILEEHVRSIVNGESIQYDADYVIKFQLRERWNNSPLGKLYQFDTTSEDYSPTQISATKFLMWLNNANMKRILGVNAASAISNLFGGSFASSKLYQKYTSVEDIRKSWFKLTSGGFYQSDEMKKNAALVDYFLPLLNNLERQKAGQLSVNTAAQILSQDWLMSPMRKTSEIVQLNIFLAVMENTGIINGKLVNLREEAARLTDYENRYTRKGTNETASDAEIKAVEKAFNDKLKELKEQYRLEKTAQFKTIQENGKDKVILDLPGIDRMSEQVSHLREIVQTMSKDALGEADEFDLANYKYSIWWRLFMTFKNWIPRQADVRFGEFRYDQAHHSYEYGRFRMFAKSLSANYVQTVARLVPLPFITGKLTNAIFTKQALIERAKELYQEKINEQKKLGKYNKDTFISEGEFIDKFIQGTESTYAEIRTLLFMSSLLFIGMAAPDDDDDSEDKAFKALMRRQLNKLIDEVGFFYSPKSGIDIAGGGAPVFSVVRDGWYVGTNMTEQFFGFSFEQLGWDEKGIKMQESAKPIKKTFKMFPVLKEILTYLPAVDEETAKDWGVKINDRRSF